MNNHRSTIRGIVTTGSNGGIRMKCPNYIEKHLKHFNCELDSGNKYTACDCDGIVDYCTHKDRIKERENNMKESE